VRATSCSFCITTLSHPPEVKEKCPEREDQQILTMRNGLYRQRNEIYPLNVRYYNPDGSLLWEGQHDRFIKSDNERPSHQLGRGWEEPGWWKVGTYRVEILIDGVKFAEGSFTIE
jgi:hypothetical protein